MMTDRISVKPKIMDLQNTNDIYMTMNLRILSTEKNLNNAVFQESFLEGTVNDKEKLVGLPFVVNKSALENDEYLTHELNTETGELGTDQVGSFVDFWIEEENDKDVLIGEVRIFKRFPTVCSKILEMYTNGILSTSCEVAITKYDEISEDGERYIGYNDGGNTLIGSAIVSDPAMVDAKPTLLIAEAYQKDIKLEQQGGENLTKTKNNKDKIEVFNKGIDVNYHGKLETSASLKWSDVRDKIYDLVNPIDTNKNRTYNYWIRDLYVDYVILEDDYDYDVLYKAPYKIDGETITIVPEEDWVKGSYGFIPEGVELNSIIEGNKSKLDELNKELSELKEENKTMSKEKKSEVELNEARIKGLEEEVKNLKATIVAEQEAKLAFEGEVSELKETVKALEPFKLQVETAQKEAKVKELNAKYSKLIADEEVFKSERVSNAIQEGNVVELNNVVVEQIAKEKATEIETASAENEDVVITASKQEDLVEQTILEKYDLA